MKKVLVSVIGILFPLLLVGGAIAETSNDAASGQTATQKPQVRRDTVSEYRSARQAKWKKVQELSAKRRAEAEAQMKNQKEQDQQKTK